MKFKLVESQKKNIYWITYLNRSDIKCSGYVDAYSIKQAATIFKKQNKNVYKILDITCIEDHSKDDGEQISLFEDNTDVIYYHGDNKFYREGTIINPSRTHILSSDVTSAYNSIFNNIDIQNIVYSLDKPDDEYIETYKYLYSITYPKVHKVHMDYSPIMCDIYLKDNPNKSRETIIELFSKAYTGDNAAKEILHKYYNYDISNIVEYIGNSARIDNIFLHRFLIEIRLGQYVLPSSLNDLLKDIKNMTLDNYENSSFLKGLYKRDSGYLSDYIIKFDLTYNPNTFDIEAYQRDIENICYKYVDRKDNITVKVLK